MPHYGGEVTQRSLRVSQETKGGGQCGQESLLWFPWEGIGDRVSRRKGGMMANFSGPRGVGTFPSCLVVGPRVV